VFQLFAIDRKLDFKHPPGRAEVIMAMIGHTLAKGILAGAYARA